MARKLIVEIVGDSRSYERAMGRSEKATKNFGRVVGGTTQRVTAGFGTFVKGAVIFQGVDAAFRLVGSAVRAGASEFSQMQQVAAQTQAVLKSTGGIAGVSAENVQTLADSLSRLSGVDDEAIASSENLILTFKNVRNVAGEGNRIFDRATLAALDLSKAAGGAFGDLPTTAKQLAKALNDPVRGMTALGRAGVTFSDAQKAAIKAMVESNNILGAQKLILREVESQVGGSAKAFGETLPGQLAKVREAFRNVFGNLAAVVAEPLAAALGAVAGVIPKVEAGVQRFATAVRPIFGDIVATAREVLPGVLRTVQSVFGPIRQFVEPIIRDVANIIRTTFGNIVQVFDDNRAQLQTIFANLGEVVRNVWTVARPTIVFLFQTVLPAALRVVIPIIEKVTGLYKVMSRIFVQVVSVIVKAISALLGGFQKMAEAASHLPFVGDKFAGVADKISAARGELDTFAGGLDALDGKQVNVDILITTRRRDEGDLTTGGSSAISEADTKKAAQAEADAAAAAVATTTTGSKTVTKEANTSTEAADDAKTAAEKAAEALRKRNEAIRAAVKAEQFRRLGLTSTGEEKTPGVEVLAKRRKSLLQQIKGTALDTAKTRAMLRRIGRVLSGDFGKVGRDVRQAILGMFNDISSALSGGGSGDTKGPLTKTSGLSMKVLEGMGLSPEEERELRRRLSGLNSAGRQLAKPGGGAKTRPPAGLRGDAGGPIVVNTSVYIDGQKVANAVTKQQQKTRRRNPGQKRGPQRRGI